jgi:hypothetical protein
MNIVKAIALTVTLPLFGLVGCVDHSFWNKIQSAFESGRQSALIKEFTDFDWDTVCILGPYSIQRHNRGERLAKRIPADLGDFEHQIPNLDSDGAYAFVFIRDEKVIAVERRGRGYGIDYDPDLKSLCLPSDMATIRSHPRMQSYIIITDK